MYQAKHNKTFRPNLSYFHGKVKNEINRIYFSEKSFGWNYPSEIFKLDDVVEKLGLKTLLIPDTNRPVNEKVLKFYSNDYKNGLGILVHRGQEQDQTWNENVFSRIKEELNKRQIGEVFNFTTRLSMKSVRKDAPDRVVKIFQLEKISEDTFKIKAEYDHTRATQKVSKTRATEIAKQILDDARHELHAFVLTIRSKTPVSLQSITEETLEHWDKVY